MKQGKRRQGGFTLLELLAATVLLAVGLAVIMSALGDAMRGYTRDEVNSSMAQVALSLMAEATVQTLQPGRQSGVRDGVDWQLECTLQDTLPGIGLYRLGLTLRQGRRIENFSTLRLQRLAQVQSP